MKTEPVSRKNNFQEEQSKNFIRVQIKRFSFEKLWNNRDSPFYLYTVSFGKMFILHFWKTTPLKSSYNLRDQV